MSCIQRQFSTFNTKQIDTDMASANGGDSVLTVSDNDIQAPAVGLLCSFNREIIHRSFLAVDVFKPCNGISNLCPGMDIMATQQWWREHNTMTTASKCRLHAAWLSKGPCCSFRLLQAILTV